MMKFLRANNNEWHRKKEDKITEKSAPQQRGEGETI